MKRRLAASVVLAFLAVPAGAQDTAFVRAFRAHATPFEIVGGRLRGLGADALTRVARENDFIMIGEDHGIREVPQFVAARRPHEDELRQVLSRGTRKRRSTSQGDS